MRIFYNRHTGQVIGTVDGFDEKTEEMTGVTIVPGNLTKDDVGVEVIGLGHPKEELARRLLEGTDPLNIDFIKVTSRGVVEKTKAEKNQILAQRAKERKDYEDHIAKNANKPSLQQQIDNLHQQIDTLKKPLPT